MNLIWDFPEPAFVTIDCERAIEQSLYEQLAMPPSVQTMPSTSFNSSVVRRMFDQSVEQMRSIISRRLTATTPLLVVWDSVGSSLEQSPKLQYDDNPGVYSEGL